MNTLLIKLIFFLSLTLVGAGYVLAFIYTGETNYGITAIILLLYYNQAKKYMPMTPELLKNT